MNKEKLPVKLSNAIENNELVLFTGSGTSYEFNFPSWNNLVVNIIDSISKEVGDNKLNAFKEILEIQAMDPLDVLTQIEKQGFRKQSFDYLVDTLRITQENDYSLQNELFELCPRIITTNYDHAFENALGDRLPKITYSSIHGITNLSKKESYLFKIHGDVDDPDKCILFQSDYDNLYKNDNDLFLTRLKSLILDKTILFIGFSLSDPYVKQVFTKVNEMTGGMMDKHYLITTQKDFNLPFIEPIILEDYSALKNKIIELKSYKKNKADQNDSSDIELTKTEGQKDTFIPKTKISVLYCEPIDKDFDFKPEFCFKSINNYEILYNQSILNIDTLRDVDSGYLFIITKVIKGNLVVEDEYLSSRQISHQELVDNISDKISGIFILTNSLPKINHAENKLPCSYILEESSTRLKKKVDSLLYKINKRREDFFNVSDKLFNSSRFNLLPLPKGKVSNFSHKHKLSRYIDKKLLTNFIGRKNDVENIVRKIIDLEFQDKVLTIKGSGGIGKTTIIIKAAIELAKRGLFNSIEYISCQSISSLENLNYQISNCLKLDSDIDVLSQLEDSHKEKNSIVILDNFETLLNLRERTQILELISVVCDYALIVTTSRQILDLEFEELYELRSLTTDEGLQLFKTYYKGQLDNEQEKILRYDIVEELLNNNPLAIKIISKGIPHAKDMGLLKGELAENIFSSENLDRIFEKPEDINIEKSKSLYYSIKYSYDKLNPQEKLSFELLSLFPDGIHIENLKKFAKQNKSSPVKITDKDIKSLDDKSLLENSGGFLKLQSIVNRFASHQFNLKEEEVKRRYYTLCFDYNYFFIDFQQTYFKISNSLELQDDNINNYLRCIDFMKYIDKEDEKKLDFIDCLNIFFRNINQYEEFISKLDKIDHLFKENPHAIKFLKLVKLQLIFWCKKFEGIPKQLNSIISKDEIKLLNTDDKIEKLIYGKVMSIHICLGESLFLIEDYLKRDFINPNITNELYRIGFIKLALKLVENESDLDFGDFEIMLANNCLDEKVLENYLKRLYKKETLEQIQVNYTKLKKNPLLEIDTESFTITNPYTRGIVYLIRALMEEDTEKKNSEFLNSLKYLKHIKFYYVEAILLYTKFLKEFGNKDDFEKFFEIGLTESKSFNFNYLKHLFLKIKDDSLAYDENQFYSEIPNLKKADLEDYTSKYLKKQKRSKKV